jgi:RND family efflux transporter MFP subunit
MPAKNGSSRFVLKLLTVLALLAAAGYFAWRYFSPIAVVEPVRRGKAVDAVTGSVNVNADGGIRALKSQAAGLVVKCDALGEDKTFRKDDVLVELDSSEIKRAIKNLENAHNAQMEKQKFAREKDPQLELAKQQLETMERLHRLFERSDKELEAARRQVEKIDTDLKLADMEAKRAQTDFEAAKEQSASLMKKMQILAPFDGTVQTPLTFEGAIIGAGDTVAMILSNARVVTAKVSEDSIAKVKLDQPAKVTLLTYPGEQFDAKVIRISETADDSQKFNVFLEVKTELSRLKHGSTGEARIIVDERENQPLIPRRAVFNDEYVYVVKNGVVEKRKVEIGFKALNAVEIRGGLEVGELVIVDYLDEHYSGQHVRLPTAPAKKS